MDGMPMPGGWTMSMMWMRMPGQSWAGTAHAFVVMWAAMMVVMMLPAFIAMVLPYRDVIVGASVPHTWRSLVFASAGYFVVWVLVGAALFPLGVAFAAVAMHQPGLARVVPVLAGVCVVLAGAVQFTRWKAHQLACCGEVSASGLSAVTAGAGAGAAWRHGLHLGVRCARCCGNLMAILLVVGVMDLAAMAVVTVGITAERFAPWDRELVRRIGVVAVGAGVVMLIRVVVQRFS